MIHKESHSHAGKVVYLKNGMPFQIEDWWDILRGQSWMTSENNVCFFYAKRSGGNPRLFDDEVVYGKVGPDFIIGNMVHINEIDWDKTNQIAP